MNVQFKRIGPVIVRDGEVAGIRVDGAGEYAGIAFDLASDYAHGVNAVAFGGIVPSTGETVIAFVDWDGSAYVYLVNADAYRRDRADGWEPAAAEFELPPGTVAQSSPAFTLAARSVFA